MSARQGLLWDVGAFCGSDDKLAQSLSLELNPVGSCSCHVWVLRELLLKHVCSTPHSVRWAQVERVPVPATAGAPLELTAVHPGLFRGSMLNEGGEGGYSLVNPLNVDH